MTQRQQFTPEFKNEIAKLMVDQNYTLQQACEASGAGETAVGGEPNIFQKNKVKY